MILFVRTTRAHTHTRAHIAHLTYSTATWSIDARVPLVFHWWHGQFVRRHTNKCRRRIAILQNCHSANSAMCCRCGLHFPQLLCVDCILCTHEISKKKKLKMPWRIILIYNMCARALTACHVIVCIIAAPIPSKNSFARFAVAKTSESDRHHRRRCQARITILIGVTRY